MVAPRDPGPSHLDAVKENAVKETAVTDPSTTQAPRPTGKIGPTIRRRQESHADDTLELWEQSAIAPSCSSPWSDASKVEVDQLLALIQGADHAVVSLTRQAPAVLWALAAKAARTPGGPLYVYAAASQQDDPAVKALLNSASSRVLVRLGAEPPGDWVVAGDSGRLFVGAPGGPRKWAVTLDAPRAGALHAAFTWLFWHRATLEAMPGTTGFRAPLDAPRLDPTSPFETQLRAGLLLRDGGDAPMLPTPEAVVSPDGATWSGNPAVALTPHKGTAFDRLRAATGQGTACVWAPLDLPRLALGRHRAALLLEEGPARIQLDFDERDALPLLQFVGDLARQPAWRFHVERKLGDVNGPVLLAGTSGPVPVKDEVEIDEGDQQAPELISMSSLEPRSWRRPSQLARTWRYTWRVLPPTAPAAAREARLVTEWRLVDEFARSQVDALRRSVEQMDAEEQKSGLLKRLGSFVSRWDQVHAARRRISAALDEVGEDLPSRRPTEATDLLDKLVAQHDAFRALRKDAWVEELQAEVDEARLRQQQAHAAECQPHRESAAKLEAEIAESRADVQTLEGHLGLARGAVEAAQGAHEVHAAEVRRLREEAVADERRSLTTELEGVTAVLAGLAERLKTAKKAERREITADQDHGRRNENRLSQKLRQIRATIDAPVPDLEDLQKARGLLGELRAKQRDLTTRIADLEKKWAAAHAKAERPFVFQPPPSRKAPAELPPLPKRPAVPVEHLPAVGRLVEHAGQRYLEIATWEQLDRALPVAKRLNAKLVAG